MGVDEGRTSRRLIPGNKELAMNHKTIDALEDHLPGNDKLLCSGKVCGKCVLREEFVAASCKPINERGRCGARTETEDFLAIASDYGRPLDCFTQGKGMRNLSARDCNLPDMAPVNVILIGVLQYRELIRSERRILDIERAWRKQGRFASRGRYRIKMIPAIDLRAEDDRVPIAKEKL
jgi:hypothetical protein